MIDSFETMLEMTFELSRHVEHTHIHMHPLPHPILQTHLNTHTNIHTYTHIGWQIQARGSSRLHRPGFLPQAIAHVTAPVVWQSPRRCRWAPVQALNNYLQKRNHTYYCFSPAPRHPFPPHWPLPQGKRGATRPFIIIVKTVIFRRLR